MNNQPDPSTSTRRGFLSTFLFALPFLSGMPLVSRAATARASVASSGIRPDDAFTGSAGRINLVHGTALLDSMHVRACDLTTDRSLEKVPTAGVLLGLLSSSPQDFEAWLGANQRLLVAEGYDGIQVAGALSVEYGRPHPPVLLRIDAAIRHLRSRHFGLPAVTLDRVQRIVCELLAGHRHDAPLDEVMAGLNRHMLAGLGKPIRTVLWAA